MEECCIRSEAACGTGDVRRSVFRYIVYESRRPPEAFFAQSCVTRRPFLSMVESLMDNGGGGGKGGSILG